jgi:hypothetical protein
MAGIAPNSYLLLSNKLDNTPYEQKNNNLVTK